MKAKTKAIGSNEVSNYLTIRKITEIICEYLDIPVSLVMSKTRKREVTECRQFIHFFCKRETNLPNVKIGAWVGDRDHATVLYSCDTITNLVLTDKTMKAKYQQIIKLIENYKKGR